jgi:ABC-type lipoprotein release transport system permease subunit
MPSYLQDVRFALRQFRKRPAFTAAAVVVLGLALGVNVAIFSLVNALLLRPLQVASS